MDTIKSQTGQFYRRGVFFGLVVSSTVSAVSVCSSEVLPSSAALRSMMQQVVVPASDTLWAVSEPPKTDEQWSALEVAATRLIDAGHQMRNAEHDAALTVLVEEPEWKAAADALVKSAAAGRDALRSRDFGAFSEATDAMYSSCEDCHSKYMMGAVRGL